MMVVVDDKGLVHRVISQSALVLGPTNFQDTPKVFAEALARCVFCPTFSSAILVACLRQRDPNWLASVANLFLLLKLHVPYLPSVEDPAKGGIFLTENPRILLEQGRFTKVPIIAGFDKSEFVFLYSGLHFLFTDPNDLFFLTVIPGLLKIATGYETNLIQISYAIKAQYYSKLDPKDSVALARTNVKMLSDMIMNSWIVEQIKLLSKHGAPIYMYTFEYAGSEDKTSNYTGEPDIFHTIEMKYLFNRSNAPIVTRKDKLFSAQFVELWTSFAATGVPAVKSWPSSLTWPATPPGKTRYLRIDEVPEVMDGYHVEDMKFWNEIVPQIAAGNKSEI